MGRHGVVTSGHYLATAAGFRILQQGGNAIDAAAATCFCLNLLEPHMNGLGGEVPTLIYSAADGKPHAISGMGWSPKALTIDWCKRHNIDMIPGDGYLPACVPAVVGTWALAVAKFGTMSFTQVLAPAVELAEHGLPMYENLHRMLRNDRATLSRYPTTQRLYYPDGDVPAVGQLFRNVDFARSLRLMCDAEKAAAGRGRVAGIEAACDAFYRGPIAETICQFIAEHPIADASGGASGGEHTGLLTVDDMADWHAAVEDPVSFHYHGLDLHKCSSWTQGPVFLQQLALLQGFDLPAMGHNSADYLHTWIECAKLAFADREAYYGDPLFDDVPLDALLSKSYNDARRQLVDKTASMQMRPGDVGRGVPTHAEAVDLRADHRRAMGLPPIDPDDGSSRRAATGDTTHLDVVDGAGNMASATPSGGWIQSSPVIEGLGFCLGTRGQMFYLNPNRPNALQPHKRPRATLTPSLVTKHGKPWMVFGTPGGDAQDQTTLQFFLNHVDFGMDLQAAVEAPYLVTSHFPSSFYPRHAGLGCVQAESRIDPAVIRRLRDRGHRITTLRDWDEGSKVMAIRFDADHGVISGTVSPRRQVGYAIGW